MRRPLPRKCLAAMVALEPLPGSPLYAGDDEAIVARALKDVDAYCHTGVDALILENSFDIPYVLPPLNPMACEVMIEVARAVRNAFEGPIGIQILEAANLDALRIAGETDLDFIRAEGFVFAHVGGAGIVEGCAGELLRRRHEDNLDHIHVFADVRKKHCSHALTADLSLTDIVRQNEFFLADGHVITGPRTGAEPGIEDLQEAMEVARQPVFIGSGITHENVEWFFHAADGFIVGSDFRRHGNFMEYLERERLDRFMEVFSSLKSAADH